MCVLDISSEWTKFLNESQLSCRARSLLMNASIQKEPGEECLIILINCRSHLRSSLYTEISRVERVFSQQIGMEVDILLRN